jgi:hypothetical protein
MTAAGPEEDPDLTYPGAPESVIAAWQRRRSPVRHGKNESLPPLDIDLEDLRAEVIPVVEPDLPEEPSRYMRKLVRLRRELAGKSELAALNADLIVPCPFPPHLAGTSPKPDRRTSGKVADLIRHHLCRPWRNRSPTQDRAVAQRPFFIGETL